MSKQGTKCPCLGKLATCPLMRQADDKGRKVNTMTNYNKIYYDAINEEIREQLSYMDDNALIEIWNAYVYDVGYFNNAIFDNDEESLESVCEGVTDAIFKTQYGDYNYRHTYFTINGNENLDSFNKLTDKNSPLILSELADWLTDEERFEDFDTLDLSDLLDELEEDDEDI